MTTAIVVNEDQEYQQFIKDALTAEFGRLEVVGVPSIEVL